MRLLSTLVLALSLLAAPAENANDLFQQALVKERTEGNLPEAIKLYQRIIEKYAANRKIAAQALLQIADCQSKLGDAQARKSLERLVRDFADQKETVAEASKRLTALSGGIKTAARVERLVWSVPRDFSSISGPTSDGRYVSGVDWQRRVAMLHDFVTGKDRPLTEPLNSAKPGDGPQWASISPDGMKIAYNWSNNGVAEFRIANTDGTSVRVLAKEELWPCSWSLDGKQIVATREKKGVEAIVLVSVPDGVTKVIKPVLSGWVDSSPDMKYIVYHRSTPGGRIGSFILSIDGRSEWPLLPEPSSANAPAFTPDGSHVVFTSNRGGSPGLWSVRVVEGKPVGEPELLKADFNAAGFVGLARDGSLYYRVNKNQSNIYLAGLNPESGRLTSEPKRVNLQSIGKAWGRVSWLPDGSGLSFWNRRNERDVLMLHTFAAGDERELWGIAPNVRGGANGPGYAGWFPDGGGIMAREKKGENLVFRRLDGRTLETLGTWTIPDLPANSPNTQATAIYSRDLMTMIFAKRDESAPCDNNRCAYEIVARSLETGKDRIVLRADAGFPRGLSVSPDASQIAVLMFDNRTGENLLAIGRVSDGTMREVYRGKDQLSSSLVWNSDGHRISAFRATPGREALLSFPVTGGAPQESPLPGRMQFNPAAVSPDGTQIALAGNDAQTEIWVITGLFPAATSKGAR